MNYRIDPFDLRLFAAVADSGSISGGAKEVSLSTAAASERLQALEHALKVTLLVRSRNGAVPTPAGRALLAHAHQVLHALDGLYAELAPFARGVRGNVRLAANTSAVSEFLPDLLGRFLAAHPESTSTCASSGATRCWRRCTAARPTSASAPTRSTPPASTHSGSATTA